MNTMNPTNRLIIIGLDGATFDVLFPLMEQGYLPNIKSLMENGVYGKLESTIPPITGPAWTALATGLNPGKTGIIDFLNKKDEAWQLRPVTSYDLKGKAFWDYLGEGGLKVGIFNYPMLFPPYEINGFMVSGIGCSVDDKITYPPSLKQKLEEITGGYENYIDYHSKKYNDEHLFLRHAYRYLSKQKKALIYLLTERPWDIFIGVISLSDWLQHLFWKHWDEMHPLYHPQRSPKYREEFIRLWDKIDELIGDILKVAANVNVFIVSDHGFGPHDQCFNLARWLIEQGYMVLRRSHKKGAKDALYKFLGLIKSLAPRSIHEVGKSVAASLRTSIVDLINFEKSKAFCLGHTIPVGAIYIQGKNSSGYSNLKKEITEKISNLGNQLGRTDIDVEIFPPEKIFDGPMLNYLPDIIFTINNWRCVIEETDDINRPIFVDESHSPRHTGTHRLSGVFIASGPAIEGKNRKISGLKIYDVFPTVLYLMGCEIPETDSRILKEIFKEGICAERQHLKHREGEGKPRHLNGTEEEKIKERLKGLGYL